jgi:hypothetical protein
MHPGVWASIALLVIGVLAAPPWRSMRDADS